MSGEFICVVSGPIANGRDIRRKPVKTLNKGIVCIFFISLLGVFFFTSFSFAQANREISSTFIQLSRSHHGWSHQQWETLFDEFESTRVKELILQYGVYNNFAHFPSDDFETTDTPPLETILRIAEARGVTVLVGLNFDEDYWDFLWAEDAQLADFLNESHVKSMLVATQINEIAQHYTSFKGWYISEEFEARTWNYYNRLDMFIRYLNDLSRDLKRLTPAASIALSTYIYEPPPAQVYYETMSQVLSNTNVTDLYFQDGIGTGHVPKNALFEYISELKNAAVENDCYFHIIIELFDDGYVSASIDRVIWQIEVANQAQPESICSFATPHYMSRFGTTGSEALLTNYLFWLEWNPSR
jgi:hypothetical protein